MTRETEEKLEELKKKIEGINNGKRSISVLSILGLIFIVLKLCGVITWSWFWVLSPFIIPFILVIILAIMLLIFVKYGMD
jgi:hypothetical protein